MIRTFNFSFTWKLCCILVSWLCFLIKWYGKCSLLFYLSTENLFCVEIPQSLYDNQQGSQQGNPTWKGTWVQLTPYLNWVLLLLLLSRFSHVQLCVTPWTAAHQAPPSLGFSRQEHWSGLPFSSPMHESEKWKWSLSVVSDSWWPHGLQSSRLLHPWDFPGKNTGVGYHCLLLFDLFCESNA